MRNPSSSSSPTAKAGGGSGSATVTAGKSTTTTPCCSKVGLKRGPWTPEEDELLANYIKKEGEGRWRTLPKRAGLLRCGKSCRLRWMNYLRPSVKRGQIAPDEEDLILRLHRLLGNRWSLIAGRIPGRTDNEIKNYWNTHLSKKLISQGIDPRTHKPLNPDSSGAANANKASSSKTNRNIPNPNPNIPASPVVTEELTPDSDSGIIPIKENIGYFQSSNLDDHQLLHGYTALPNSDGNSGMGLRGNYNNGPSSTEEEDDMNYCSDDVFSSFLNSLINDDAFASQHHQLQQHPSTGIAPVSSDPLISISTSSFGGLGAGWELFAADDQVMQYSTTSFIEITGNQTPLVHKLYVVNHLGDTMVKRLQETFFELFSDNAVLYELPMIKWGHGNLTKLSSKVNKEKVYMEGGETE